MTEPTFGNNTVVQVGIIVRDIETKACAWSEILDLSMPNIIITDTMDKTQSVWCIVMGLLLQPARFHNE